MLWWVARKTHEVSESHPHESWFDMFLVIMGFLFGVVFGPCLQTSCIKLFSSYATIISMNLFVLCGKLCSGCCVASIGSLYLWYSKDGGNHVWEFTHFGQQWCVGSFRMHVTPPPSVCVASSLLLGQTIATIQAKAKEPLSMALSRRTPKMEAKFLFVLDLRRRVVLRQNKSNSSSHPRPNDDTAYIPKIFVVHCYFPEAKPELTPKKRGTSLRWNGKGECKSTSQILHW